MITSRVFSEFWGLFCFDLYFRCHFVLIFAKLCLLVDWVLSIVELPIICGCYSVVNLITSQLQRGQSFTSIGKNALIIHLNPIIHYSLIFSSIH